MVIYKNNIFCVLFLYREVARKISRIIALALDLNADYFDKPEILEKPIAILRPLHYGGGTQIVHSSCTNLYYPHFIIWIMDYDF